ncbi:phage tail assembly protein [Shinella yambaruensis]|uniref:phage tail assembly protein n=1 Tax=Shinella yambaruensis TaxID=415996 RepID=UPI003D79929D
MNDETVTFALSKPVEHGGTTYTTLTLREALAGDLAAADAVTGDMNKSFAIIASLAEVPIQVIKKIRARDLGPLMAQVAPLLGEPAAAAGPT